MDDRCTQELLARRKVIPISTPQTPPAALTCLGTHSWLFSCRMDRPVLSPAVNRFFWWKTFPELSERSRLLYHALGPGLHQWVQRAKPMTKMLSPKVTEMKNKNHPIFNNFSSGYCRNYDTFPQPLDVADRTAAHRKVVCILDPFLSTMPGLHKWKIKHQPWNKAVTHAERHFKINTFFFTRTDQKVLSEGERILNYQ